MNSSANVNVLLCEFRDENQKLKNDLKNQKKAFTELVRQLKNEREVSTELKNVIRTQYGIASPGQENRSVPLQEEKEEEKEESTEDLFNILFDSLDQCCDKDLCNEITSLLTLRLFTNSFIDFIGDRLEHLFKWTAGDEFLKGIPREQQLTLLGLWATVWKMDKNFENTKNKTRVVIASYTSRKNMILLKARELISSFI